MRTEPLPLQLSPQERARMFPAQVESLQKLIDLCEEGYRGLDAAGASVSSAPQLAHLLKQYARQRCAFSRELQGLVRVLGGRPQVSATAGALKKGWLSLRSFLETSDESLLKSCVEEEAAAITAYEAALATPYPAAIRAAIERQADEIRKIHGHLAALRPGH